MALPDFDLILFGGTGDLAMRKLLPAMYARQRAHDLPPGARIICVGRNEGGDAEFLATVERDVKPNIAPALLREDAWQAFCQRIRYVALDATDPATYAALAAALRPDPGLTRVFYLATPPALFAAICRQPGGQRPGNAGHARGAGKAAGPRSGQRAPDQCRGRPGICGVADLPHRPLPRQGNRAEPAGAALRQHPVRTAVAARMDFGRADHDRRRARRRQPHGLLRDLGRAARHAAEPLAAAAVHRRHGAAGVDLAGRGAR